MAVVLSVISAALSCAAAAGLGGQHVDPNVPDYDFQWVTVGDPGNRWTRPDETPLAPDHPLGKVNYRYRISKTEVSDAQYFEFVQAYAPHVPVHDWGDSDFSSGGVFVGVANGVPQYTLSSHEALTPATMSWRYAARYVNWLGNGKVNEEWAFETGAYDTSTFHTNPDGTTTDQEHHTPGADFWIPSLDEWTKAVHWDPEAGEGGTYWRHPYGSDAPAISGCPHEPGAQTNAGITNDQHQQCPDSDLIAQYPDALTPWGLLDASGGAREWLEGFLLDITMSRQTKGSAHGMGEFFYRFDQIDVLGASSPEFGPHAFRLASIIPAPHCATPVVLTAILFTRRK
jgi:hypothetical protein